jgi:hypothetical protein
LCWLDESPQWLSALVASLSKANVDHLIACDGAYQLWPNASNRWVSGPEQAEAILETARGLGIGTTIYTPSKPYVNNEVEKRNLSIQLALLEGELHEDWMIILDSDEVIDWAAHDFKQQLADTDLNVASYYLFEREDRHANDARTLAGLAHDMSDVGHNSIRAIQRLLPGLRLEGAHHVFCHGYGAEKSYLWGRGDKSLQQEPYLDLDEFIRVEHRHYLRGFARAQAAKQYYDLRDAIGAEQELWKHHPKLSPVIADAQPRDIPARTITVRT